MEHSVVYVVCVGACRGGTVHRVLSGVRVVVRALQCTRARHKYVQNDFYLESGGWTSRGQMEIDSHGENRVKTPPTKKWKPTSAVCTAPRM